MGPCDSCRQVSMMYTASHLCFQYSPIVSLISYCFLHGQHNIGFLADFLFPIVTVCAYYTFVSDFVRSLKNKAWKEYRV